MRQPLAWALAALMDPGPLRRAEHKLACLRRIASAALTDIEGALLANCVESYLELNPEEAAELTALGRLDMNQEIQTMRLTWAERLEAKGREQGIELGREQGREQGANRRHGRLLSTFLASVLDLYHTGCGGKSKSWSLWTACASWQREF